DLNPPGASGTLKYWTTSSRALYMPLTYTVWAWTAQAAYDPVTGLSAGWFHALNLLLHTLAAFAVFAVLAKLLTNRFAALIGALLFLLHPIQVEAVAWVAEAKDLLAALLAIVGVWQFVSFRRSKDWTSYALAMVAFVLAMLAKPSAVVGPMMAIIVDV